MRKTFLLLLLSIINQHALLSQENITSEFGNTLVEITGEENEFLNEAEEKYENLLEIYERQENINLVSEQVLESLTFLTEFQVYSFLNYRNKYGKIYSINELRLIPGFHKDLIRKFSLLFNFEASSSGPSSIPGNKKKIYNKILTRSKLELPFREGFTSYHDTLNEFHGSKFYRLIKYEFGKKDRVRAGFTLESDAGEKIAFDSISKGFGFNSIYLEVQNAAFLEKAVAGDFKVQSAEGLVFSNSRGGKSFENAFQRKLPQLKKFSSTAEYGFYRGLASQIGFNGFRIISFISQTKNSGKIYQEPDSSRYFKSQGNSGLFRNTGEKLNYKNIREKTGGLIFSWTNDHLQAGYNLKVSLYDPEIEYQSRGDQWTPSIRENLLYWNSVFYSFQFQKILLTGEFAKKNFGGSAFQQKISFYLHPLLSLNFSYRNFSPLYFCPGTNTFSESGNSRNEQGLYIGILSYPFPFVKLKTYLDQYRFPWIDNRATFPARGTDFAVDSEWYLDDKLDLRIFFKLESKFSKDSQDEGMIGKMSNVQTSRFYTQFTWAISEHLSSRSRFEVKIYRIPHNKHSGNLIYQEFTRSFPNISAKINLRYSVFDIPDWNVRIYSWEHDLLYSFSSPSFYKAGYNLFLNIRYKPNDFWNLGLKLSITGYNSLRESGTGPDYRAAANFYELKAQCIIKI